MKLFFRVDLGDESEQDPDPIVINWPSPGNQAGCVIRVVRYKLMNMYRWNCGRIRVFLNEVRIQSHRTLGEQGVVDGSLLTVRWLWSEEQRKKTNCLTHAERVEKCQKIASKREAFLREKGTTSEELFSLGFIQNPYINVMSRKRERSPISDQGKIPMVPQPDRGVNRHLYVQKGVP